uniref:Uncharacterized protein n=1 Tax=Rhizophora mucronata TaxID=61149 RepID=A0A2P2N0Q5_RHIMU
MDTSKSTHVVLDIQVVPDTLQQLLDTICQTLVISVSNSYQTYKN